MRDDGEGALSAITVSSRELMVRGAAGAGLGRGRVCVERPRQRITPPPPEGYTDQLGRKEGRQYIFIIYSRINPLPSLSGSC